MPCRAHAGKHQGPSGGRRTEGKTVERTVYNRVGKLLGRNVPNCAGSGAQMLICGWRSEYNFTCT